jgi:hypothetical protein
MAYHIISADSHFVEPPNMWAERIDKKFRDRAPHTDSPWPRSRQYIEGPAFQRITPEETQKIVGDNAARLYGIPLQ